MHKYTVLHSIVIAKGLKIAVIAVFAIGLLVFVIAEGCIVSQMSAEPKEDLDYMIVLGGTGAWRKTEQSTEVASGEGGTGVGTPRESRPCFCPADRETARALRKQSV